MLSKFAGLVGQDVLQQEKGRGKSGLESITSRIISWEAKACDS